MYNDYNHGDEDLRRRRRPMGTYSGNNPLYEQLKFGGRYSEWQPEHAGAVGRPYQRPTFSVQQAVQPSTQVVQRPQEIAPTVQFAQPVQPNALQGALQREATPGWDQAQRANYLLSLMARAKAQGTPISAEMQSIYDELTGLVPSQGISPFGVAIENVRRNWIS